MPFCHKGSTYHVTKGRYAILSQSVNIPWCHKGSKCHSVTKGRNAILSQRVDMPWCHKGSICHDVTKGQRTMMSLASLLLAMRSFNTATSTILATSSLTLQQQQQVIVSVVEIPYFPLTETRGVYQNIVGLYWRPGTYQNRPDWSRCSRRLRQRLHGCHVYDVWVYDV